MIRKKAKSLLLSVMLIMASIIFFGCKDEVYIKVESVSFVDQSINLLVGEEYEPEVKILPSYATDRSYTLISSDNVALSVNGGIVKALSPAKGVALKVEYNADKTYNDVVLVNIYAQSEKLATPTEFKFDGNKFSFVGVDNAEAYILEINGEEINIGNNTQYLFDNADAKLGDLYNKELSCSVKAIADGKIFTESDPSNTISVVKMSSVQNIKIENKILSFDSIDNVAKYDVKIELNGIAYQTMQISENEFDLGSLVEYVANSGAEYIIKVAPSKDGYNATSGVELFGAEFTEIEYTVIGKVNNVTLNGKVVSWDFVKNAQNYTLKLYKSSRLIDTYDGITTNSVTLDCEDAGSYMCNVIANSNDVNTATGTVYSDNLNFEILEAPEVTIGNYEVKWNSVSGAQSYLITINRIVNGEKQELTKTFVDTTSLVLEEFESGNYEVEVVAYSNNKNVLPSKAGNGSWSKFGLCNLRVINGVLFWDNTIENTIKRYEVVANGITKTINGVNSCNLDVFEFTATGTEAKDYYIKVKALGAGTEFDSDEEIFKVTKLPDAIITKLQNKVFSVYCVNGATCQVKIYKDDVEVVTLGSNLTLDVAGWAAGEYVARAIVTGNGAEILDADNSTISGSANSKKFIKLASPELSISEQSLTIANVENATEYILTENGEEIAQYTLPFEFDLATRLTGKASGDYVYAVKAVGNGGDIIDSSASIIKVKKLSVPSVSFNNTTLVCTANCVEGEQSYIENYTVYINENNSLTTNSLTTAAGTNTIDCSSVIEGVGEYGIQAIANPRVVSDTEYNLILASDKSEVQKINKLSGECSIVVDGGRLVVTPVSSLTSGLTYNLTLNIKGNGQDISVTTTNIGDNFVVDVVDDKYVPYEKFEDLFKTGGEYKLYTTVAPYGTTSEIASDSVKCNQPLNILEAVSETVKQEQSIKFKKVSNANGYKAIITLNNVATELDIKDKIQDTNDDNYYKIDITDLKALMESKGISYLEGVDYKIKFIATSTNSNTLSNYKAGSEYVFQFLKAPTVEIITQNEQKVLNITAEVTVKHNIIIRQNGELVEGIYNTDDTSIILDNITSINGGEVEISVNNVYAGDGNVFDSSYTNITATKLALAADTNFTTRDGKLVWSKVDNAKYYSISYFVESTKTNEVINLSYGSPNFKIEENEGICIYDFKDLEEGDKTLKLQIYGEDGNYLNSNILTLAVHKLKVPTISVVDGMICITIKEDIAKVRNLGGIELGFGDFIINDLFKLGTDVIGFIEDDETTTDDDEKIKEYEKYFNSITIKRNGDSWVILIDAEHFIEYGTTEMLEQIVTVKLYSTTAVNRTVLNSNTSQKTVKGLLAPTDIEMNKSLTTDSDGSVIETAEKIVWAYSNACGDYVSKYQVVINYLKLGFEDVDYTFDIEPNKNFLEMPKYYPDGEDANGDGINNYNEDANNSNHLDMGEDLDNNGILNGLEQAFLDGDYRITVRAFTSNNEMYVHSARSDVFEMTILNAPQDVGTEDGVIAWDSHERTEINVVRIYKLTDSTGVEIDVQDPIYTLIANNENDKDSIDISGIKLDTAVYGFTVQSLSTNNENVLSSKASEMVQFIRLPQEASYTIDDGKLYVKLHKFYTTCYIKLTDDEKTCTLTSTNDLDEFDDYHFNEFVKQHDSFSWLNSQVLQTFTDPNYYTLEEINLENEFITRSNGYKVEIKLTGNSRKDAIVTTLTSATNANKDENGNSFGLVNRMPTPTVSIDENTRGLVTLKLDKVKKNMKYFAVKDADGKIVKCLQGVHLYKTTIFADKRYVVYMADIVDTDLFYEIYPELRGEDFDWFEYGEIRYNVVNIDKKDNKTHVQINLNAATYDVYHYYQDENGELLKDENDALVVGDSINLSLGGSIIIQSQMMGDDSVFVNSNISNKTCMVMRYKAITPSLDNGQIKWLKQDVVMGEDVIYESAYLIEVSNGVKIMLYNPDPDKMNKDDLDRMLKDEGKNYIFDSEYQEVIETNADGKKVTYIIYGNLANKLKEHDNSFNGGDYNVSVWAHYTNVTGSNIILAQTAPVQSVSIIPQANIDLVDGMLTWNMPTLSSTGATGTITFEDYKLQVFADDKLEATIDLSVGNYEVYEDRNNKYFASIDLKRTYNEFTFKTGVDYTFKLIATGDSVSYINSALTVLEDKEILGDIGSDLAINKGVVTWAGTGNDEVKVVFRVPTDDGGSIEYSFKDTSTTGRYELPSWVEIGNTDHELSDEYSYVFSVRAKGNSNYISGFFSEKTVQIQRLSTVTGIKGKDGKLTWNKSVYYSDVANGITSSEGVTYTVYYIINGDTEIKSIDNLKVNEVDVDDIEVQGITVLFVIAHHQSYADSSEGKQQVPFIRLQEVDTDSVDFVENGTVMQWTPSIDNGNVNKYYRIKVTDGTNTRTYDYELEDGKTVASWTIEIDTIFKGKQVSFEIKTLSKGEGYLLNSLYSTPVEKTISASIASLSYDSDKYAIYWTPINSGKIDTYYVGYKFNNTTNVYEDITSKIVKEDGKYYYYLENIGTYTGVAETEPYNGIYVRVVSGNNVYERDLASRATRYNATISFDIFDSGSGVEGKAYIIKDGTQLENISYRPNACFELGREIYLSSSYKTVNKFSGSLDGKGKYIYGSSSTKFAGIFNETDNAVLKDINISGFILEIVPTSANFNFAILTTKATNTKFENIKVVYSSITFTKDVTTRDGYSGDTSANGEIYIGTIAGYATNCEFENCAVIMLENSTNITINARGNSEIKIYVGSIVGYISGGSIETDIGNATNTYTFVMQTSLKNFIDMGYFYAPILSVGAVAGLNDVDNAAEITGTYYKYSKDGSDLNNFYNT